LHRSVCWMHFKFCCFPSLLFYPLRMVIYILCINGIMNIPYMEKWAWNWQHLVYYITRDYILAFSPLGSWKTLVVSYFNIKLNNKRSIKYRQILVSWANSKYLVNNVWDNEINVDVQANSRHYMYMPTYIRAFFLGTPHKHRVLNCWFPNYFLSSSFFSVQTHWLIMNHFFIECRLLWLYLRYNVLLPLN